MALFGFGGKQRFVQTIRLFVLQTDGRAALDRPRMLAALLQAWQEAIGHPPDELDIYGPYGIAKGSTVGLKAFHTKLRDKGHAKYDGYSGGFQRSGFIVTFFRSPPYGTNFVEIVLWFDNDDLKVDAVNFVDKLACEVEIDYGFVTQLGDNLCPRSEAEIKRGIFGGMSIQVGTNSLSRWHQQVETILDGAVRDIYPQNFLNDRQLDRLRQLTTVQSTAVGQGLHLVDIRTAEERRFLRHEIGHVA